MIKLQVKKISEIHHHSRGPFVLSVNGKIRQTPSSNCQTKQTSSITSSTNFIATSSLKIKIPTCEQESSDNLKSKNAILRVQNEQLRQQVNEITEQLQTVTLKFNSLQKENQTLLMINNEFDHKNDKLYKSLERY
ncbi:4089_t:CDS:2, partial [Rhizophagus irregularis]